MTIRGEANISILSDVVTRLGDLCDSLVFVGGCATGLLITATQAQEIRVTYDVDAISALTTLKAYHDLANSLRERGFVEDQTEGVICRFTCGPLKLDVMGCGDFLGFENRWYSLAIDTAETVTLPSGSVIRLISATAFLATKLAAFRNRGAGDYLASHDLEDIITVIDGRPELVEEVRSAPLELRRFIADEVSQLLATSDFIDAVPSHLAGDAASQARVPIVLDRLRKLATIE